MAHIPSTPAPQEPSQRAAVTLDTSGLGSTASQRGAEILAALRAELQPTPETKALSRLAGRAIAWVILRLERNHAALNFVTVRPSALTHLVRQHLPPDGVFVDLEVGFHPRGLILGRQRPDARLIEIDIPSIIRERRRRIESHLLGGLLPNIELREADLGVTPLSAVLQSQQADVICSEGLNAYFTPPHITQIAAGVRDCLKPGGVYVTDMAWQIGMQEAQDATRFYSRQAGRFHGVMPDLESMYQLLIDAGFSKANITAYRPSELAQTLGLPTPVIDFAYFFVARK